MEDVFLTQQLLDRITARYESDEILELLGIDSEELCRILGELLLDNLEKFDVNIY